MNAGESVKSFSSKALDTRLTFCQWKKWTTSHCYTKQCFSWHWFKRRNYGLWATDVEIGLFYGLSNVSVRPTGLPYINWVYGPQVQLRQKKSTAKILDSKNRIARVTFSETIRFFYNGAIDNRFRRIKACSWPSLLLKTTWFKMSVLESTLLATLAA